MVDDDVGRQLGEEILKLGQVRRLEIDDDMPAVLEMRSAISFSSSCGVKSTSRLTKLNARRAPPPHEAA